MRTCRATNNRLMVLCAFVLAGLVAQMLYLLKNYIEPDSILSGFSVYKEKHAKAKQLEIEQQHAALAQLVGNEIATGLKEQDERVNTAVKKIVGETMVEDKFKIAVDHMMASQQDSMNKMMDAKWEKRREWMEKHLATQDREYQNFLEQKAKKELRIKESKEKRKKVHDELIKEYDQHLKESEDHLLRHIELSEEDKQLTPKNIVILTGCDKKRQEQNATRFEEITRNRQEYADRHGFTYQFMETDGFKVEGDSPTWAKLAAMRKAYKDFPHAEWFWWLDDDALIVNQDINIAEQILNPKVLEQRITWGWPFRDVEFYFTTHLCNRSEVGSMDEIHIVMTQDPMSWNTGSFMLRGTTWMDEFLDLWDERLWRDQKLRHSEQSTLIQLAHNHPSLKKKVATVGQRLMNSYYKENRKYQQGDLVVHFAGNIKKRDHFADLWSQFYNYSKVSGQVRSDSTEPGI